MSGDLSEVIFDWAAVLLLRDREREEKTVKPRERSCVTSSNARSLAYLPVIFSGFVQTSNVYVVTEVSQAAHLLACVY